MISTDQIKVLRERTGVSVMQCRKALEEAGADMEKALILLRKHSAEIADKRTGRTLGAGAVASYIHAKGSMGALVELFSETDFVSGNPEFQSLARDIAMQITATNPEYVSWNDITPEIKEKVKETFLPEVKGKPVAIKEKILEGKLKSYFDERILLEQPYVKNPETTVKDVLQSAIQKFGERIEIGRFMRYAIRK